MARAAREGSELLLMPTTPRVLDIRGLLLLLLLLLVSASDFAAAVAAACSLSRSAMAA
jgi:hypothetical protein